MTTEIILSPAPELQPRAAFQPDAEGRKARAGILHRPDQQRPHAQGAHRDITDDRDKLAALEASRKFVEQQTAETPSLISFKR